MSWQYNEPWIIYNEPLYRYNRLPNDWTRKPKAIYQEYYIVDTDGNYITDNNETYLLSGNFDQMNTDWRRRWDDFDDNLDNY